MRVAGQACRFLMVGVLLSGAASAHAAPARLMLDQCEIGCVSRKRSHSHGVTLVLVSLGVRQAALIDCADMHPRLESDSGLAVVNFSIVGGGRPEQAQARLHARVV